MSAPQKTSLFYKDGSSDKEYHIQLLPKDSNWIVEFQYGRRGSSLKAGTKTAAPVAYDVALKAYSKVVQEKLKDGYTESEGGLVYQSTLLEQRFTGVVPQLLNPVDETDLESLLGDDNYVMQEKFDGERRLIQLHADGTLVGINRKGLVVPLPDTLVQAVRALGLKSVTLDGEILGQRFAPFDILELDGADLKTLPLSQRDISLKALLAAKAPQTAWVPTPLAQSKVAKVEMFRRIKEELGEGVVFKQLSSTYVAGRPASGGSQRKFKFVESATVVVTKTHPTKSSVFFAGFDSNNIEIALGKVTIPPNHSIPNIGDVVEVQYLYAFPQGSLFQPVYKGVREDQSKDDCTLTQLKYKAGTDLPEVGTEDSPKQSQKKRPKP